MAQSLKAQAALDTLRSAVMAQPAGPGRRRLIALAGPPAAGKSTLAEALVADLGAGAALVPMDGFHLDNALLEPAGLLARKGAPETFDAPGFLAAMRRVRAGEEVVLPSFDRPRDLARAGAVRVVAEVQWVVVEGNYLLFDAPVWRELAPLWDVAALISPPLEVLEARLVQRWRDHGLGEAAARERARGNDLANARRMLGAVIGEPLRIGA